jgi:hypothetical protein
MHRTSALHFQVAGPPLFRYNANDCGQPEIGAEQVAQPKARLYAGLAEINV